MLLESTAILLLTQSVDMVSHNVIIWATTVSEHGLIFHPAKMCVCVIRLYL